MVGDEITLIGARALDPDARTMTLIKEINLPAKNWSWVKPTRN
jgi:hypothetical protein